MKWLKRLLFLLTGLLLSGALIVTALMLVLDEPGHKRLLVWAAGQFLDSELIIDGPLELDLGRDLTLATEDVRLEADDGSFTLTLGELRTSFRLGSYLRTGTFWFNSLELHEVNLMVERTSNNRSAAGHFKLPPVVIARARFNNLTLSYRKQPPGTLHQFSLEELVIEEAGRGQPVSLYATGLFDGQPFVLEGTSDSIAELLETPEPKKVQLSLSGEQGKIVAQGTIADPVNGRGLDLLIRADVPQINHLIDIFWNEIPVLGTLQGSLKLRGDYRAPRLEDIELQLARDQEVEFNVQGAVADAHSGRGLDLQFDGRSSNPQVLSWLVFKKLDGMQALEISGSLKGDIDQPALHDLDAFAETADGLRFELGGSALLRPAGYRLTPADADLTIEISAPTLAASKLPGLEEIPVSGPVSAKAQLALGRDALGVYQADVTIGDRNDGRIQLNGDVGRVPFAATPALAGLKLLTDVQYAELARLGEQLDYPLPALGQARLRGTLVSRGSELVLQGAELDIGTPDQAILQATGMLTAPLDDPGQLRAAMDVTIQAPELAMLGKPFEVKLPELGQTRITGRLEATRSGWKFSNARLAVGDVDEPTIHARGGATSDLKTGSTIDVALNMGVNGLVTAYTELPAPTGDLGRLEGDAVITARDGGWGIKQFKLRSTGTGLYRLNLDGSYNDLVNHDDARMNTRLVVRDPDKLGEALGIHLPSTSVYRMQGLLSLHGGRLRYEGEAKVGQSKSITAIDGRLKDNKPVLSGNVEIPVLYLADFGIRPSSDPVPIQPDQVETASLQVFSRKPMDFGFLHNFDLDMTLSIDKVESGEVAINSVSSRLQLSDGQLSIRPLRLVFEGGNVDVDLVINATQIPEYRLAVAANEVTLGPLLAQRQGKVSIEGHSSIDLDLSARGHSAHQLASSLSGKINLAVENARIPKYIVDQLSVNVFGWAISRAGAGQEHLNLNCLVMTFDANEGMVESETIIADGPRLSIGGQIDLDLGNETLDIVLVPTQKWHYFSSISPVSVKGPIRNPSVDAVPVRAALQEIGALALIPGIMLPARAIGKLWSWLDDEDQVGEGCAGIEQLREAAKRANTDDEEPEGVLDWLRE